jgi:hypothetical protein
MTDKQTPPDWVLIEAAKRSGWQVLDGDLCVPRYWLNNNGAFRALCDMIERYEQPPVDRKLLCAGRAAAEEATEVQAAKFRGGEYDDTYHVTAPLRAIELWEKGFGK